MILKQYNKALLLKLFGGPQNVKMKSSNILIITMLFYSSLM